MRSTQKYKNGGILLPSFVDIIDVDRAVIFGEIVQWNAKLNYPSNMILLRIHLDLNTLATIFCLHDGVPSIIEFSPVNDESPSEDFSD